jgi:hypothetical protein
MSSSTPEWRLVTTEPDCKAHEGGSTHSSFEKALEQARITYWRGGVVLRIECPDGHVVAKDKIDLLLQLGRRLRVRLSPSLRRQTIDDLRHRGECPNGAVRPGDTLGVKAIGYASVPQGIAVEMKPLPAACAEIGVTREG